MEEFQLNRIEEAIEDIRQGKMIIVVDDESRENEGDFIAAAECMTPEMANFMARYGRGLMCAPISNERADELDLPYMVTDNNSLHSTPFTISVDLLGHGCTTGISTYDRAMTLKFLADPNVKSDQFGRPGHIFPLRARSRGVLRRAGHTEAAVDLCRLAGKEPVGVLIEILNEDGTMARVPDLIILAKEFNIKMISIADLIKYRLQKESLVETGVEVKMPTRYGDFHLIPFRQKSNGLEHIALIKGRWEPGEPILVRMHSSCMTGDIFGSKRCECGDQLHTAMTTIQKEGKGVIVYMNQEGRGIGLMNKIKAYKLQEEGLDTVDANLHLGFQADERDYGVGASILKELGITNMRLMTNNPCKRIGLEGYGLHITENVPIEVGINKYNEFYMHTKKEKMGHTLKTLK